MTINSALQIINTLILIVTAIQILYGINGVGVYVDYLTPLLSFFLWLEIRVAIKLCEENTRPLLFALAVSLLVFFQLRLLALSFGFYSTVFQRFQFDSNGLNFSLLYIIVASAIMIFSIKSGFSRNILGKEDVYIGRGFNHIFNLYFVISLIAYNIISLPVVSSNMPRWLMALIQIIEPRYVIFQAVVYLSWICYRNGAADRFIIFGIIVEIFLITLNGNRSAAYMLMVFGLCIISVQGWNRSIVPLTIKNYFSIALILMILLFTFWGGSKIRDVYGHNRGHLTVAQAIDSMIMPAQVGGVSIMQKLSDRIGYLDYNSEVIENADKYRVIINPSVYFKSLIDNILTPGFDIYNQPKIQYLLAYVYQNRQDSPKKSMIENSYQSDAIGIFGESYILFGVFGLAFIAICAHIFQYILNQLDGFQGFGFYFLKVYVVLIFYELILSFGIDQVLIGAIQGLIIPAACHFLVNCRIKLNKL